MDCGWIVLLRDSVNKPHHYSDRSRNWMPPKAKLAFFCL